MRELFNVQTKFVSLIEAGANRKKFKIFKSADHKEEKINKEDRYEELAQKFYKEGLGKKIKVCIKDWFDRMRKAQDEIDNEEKGGRTMDKEKELEEQKKVKEKAKEDARIQAEKVAKERKEKAEEEEMKGKVASAVEAILLNKERREELKGLIEKVEKNEEIKPEEMLKLKEALGIKTEEKPKEIEALKARIEKLENPKGKKKSVEGQDGGDGENTWPSFSG